MAIFSSGHFVKVTRTQVHGSAELLQKRETYTMNSVIKLFTSTLCCRLFCKRIIPLQFQELHCSKCSFCEISGRNGAAHKAQFEKCSCMSLCITVCIWNGIYTHRMEQKSDYYLIQSMKNQQHLQIPQLSVQNSKGRLILKNNLTPFQIRDETPL